MPEFCRAVADWASRRSICSKKREWPVVAPARADLLDGLRRRRIDPRRPQRHAPTTTRSSATSRRRSRSAAQLKMPERDHVLRQPRAAWATRRRSPTASPGSTASRRSPKTHGVTICVELLNSKVDHPDYQGDRTGVRRRDREGGRLAAREAALRHLPHADHGRGSDPHDPRQQGLDRALSHRRRARPPRARRHAGGELARRRARAIVDTGLHRLHGPRVRADARSADVAAGGGRAVRRVNHDVA